MTFIRLDGLGLTWECDGIVTQKIVIKSKFYKLY